MKKYTKREDFKCCREVVVITIESRYLVVVAKILLIFSVEGKSECFDGHAC